MYALKVTDDAASEPTTTVSGPQVLVTVTVNGFRITISKRNLEHFDAQDPYFFDADYTIAGSTGFLLWEANWLLLRLLRSASLPPAPGAEGAAPRAGDVPSDAGGPSRTVPSVGLGHLLAGRRVLDLGSGTGLAGLSAAAWGAHVLLTDLASVCEGALRANVKRNALEAKAPETEAAADTPATAGTAPIDVAEKGNGASAPAGRSGAEEGVDQEREGGQEFERELRGEPWAGAVRVGRGSASVMPLDWTEPLEPQVRAGGNDPRDADFILAVDTIWLLDILHAFIDVVLAVLTRDRAPAGGDAAVGQPPPQQQSQHQRACFMAFVERAGEDSKLFVRKEAVEQELRARGCDVEVLIAEDVDVDGAARPGRVLRVTLAAANGPA